MSTVSGLIITYLRKHPGSQNPDIRRELARHGYTTFTKKSLNQLLYSLSPDLLVWRDLPEGGRHLVRGHSRGPFSSGRGSRAEIRWGMVEVVLNPRFCNQWSSVASRG